MLDHTEPRWGADDGLVELLGGGKPLATFTDYGRHVEPVHVTRWDPARVLAECEAKRQIVELHQPSGEGYTRPDGSEWDACTLCQWDVDCESPKHDYQPGAGEFPCDTLRALAAPYAGHPDFDPAWRL